MGRRRGTRVGWLTSVRFGEVEASGIVDDVVFPIRRRGSGGSGGEAAGVADVAGFRIAQLMDRPDLADFNKTLDAVFLGTTDLSGVKTELDKIDVTSVPAPSEKIDVVKVNGKPAYIVHTSAVQMRTVDAAGSPVSAPVPRRRHETS